MVDEVLKANLASLEAAGLGLSLLKPQMGLGICNLRALHLQACAAMLTLTHAHATLPLTYSASPVHASVCLLAEVQSGMPMLMGGLGTPTTVNGCATAPGSIASAASACTTHTTSAAVAPAFHQGGVPALPGSPEGAPEGIADKHSSTSPHATAASSPLPSDPAGAT